MAANQTYPQSISVAGASTSDLNILDNLWLSSSNSTANSLTVYTEDYCFAVTTPNQVMTYYENTSMTFSGVPFNLQGLPTTDITYTATLANNVVLPAWIVFNPSNL